MSSVATATALEAPAETVPASSPLSETPTSPPVPAPTARSETATKTAVAAAESPTVPTSVQGLALSGGAHDTPDRSQLSKR